MTPDNVKLPGLKPYRLPRVLTPKKNIIGEGGWENLECLRPKADEKCCQFVQFTFFFTSSGMCRLADDQDQHSSS